MDIVRGVGRVPFVVLLSILGLKASPEKSVTNSGWSVYFSESRYSWQAVTKRATPPTGSADEGSTIVRQHTTELAYGGCTHTMIHVVVVQETKVWE
jgi:hypothetical protein